MLVYYPLRFAGKERISSKTVITDAAIRDIIPIYCITLSFVISPKESCEIAAKNVAIRMSQRRIRNVKRLRSILVAISLSIKDRISATVANANKINITASASAVTASVIPATPVSKPVSAAFFMLSVAIVAYMSIASVRNVEMPSSFLFVI